MVKSVIYTDTPEEIRDQVIKAIKALTGVQTINIERVSVRAAMRLHGSKNTVKKYLDGLTERERTDLGFPDPNAKRPSSSIVLRPTTQVSQRTLVPARRR